MTEHYGAAQIREIYDALEKIKSESGRVNVSLLSLVRGERIYQKPTTK
jgi:hypothetical protein